MTDTIVAIATPIGRSGVGVVRLSGPRAKTVAQKIWRSTKSKKLTPRYLHLGWLYDGTAKLDQAFLAYMPAPHSYTGEDVVEIQTHGSPVVLEWVVERATRSGARMAEPGEFTKRAYFNGKIDITQAEAVNDVIYAASLAAAKSATDQLAGSLNSQILDLTTDLIAISAAETAYLDFGDEDIIGQSDALLARQLKATHRMIKKLLIQQKEAGLLREGVTVALIGLPNAGKSTLLNRLVAYDRSIVTEIAGTTRDHIEETVVISDIPMRLIDTAGLTKTDNAVEQIGVQRSQVIMSGADIVLLLIEPNMLKKTQHYLSQIKLKNSLDKSNTIIVQSKLDKGLSTDIKNVFKGYKTVAISAQKNTGISTLKQALSALAKSQINRESATISAARHIALLQKAAQNLDNALALIAKHCSRDIVLVEIDEAIVALNELRGSDIDQAKIDAMFANFCIGK